jgi:hypothetical protein
MVKRKVGRYFKISVAEPHPFYAAPAPGENFVAAPAPTLLYGRLTFFLGEYTNLTFFSSDSV